MEQQLRQHLVLRQLGRTAQHYLWIARGAGDRQRCGHRAVGTGSDKIQARIGQAAAVKTDLALVEGQGLPGDAEIAAYHAETAQRLRRVGATGNPNRAGKLGEQTAAAHHDLTRRDGQVEPDHWRRRGWRRRRLPDDTNIKHRYLNRHALRDADLGVQHVDLSADRKLPDGLAVQAHIGIEDRRQSVASHRARVSGGDFQIDRQPWRQCIDRAADTRSFPARPYLAGGSAGSCFRRLRPAR